MKFFVAIALIACVACVAGVGEFAQKLTEEQRANARAYGAECREKFGVTKEQVQELRSGHFVDVDDKVKAFSNCFLEKIGFLQNGVPQTEVITTKLIPIVGEAETKAITEKCNGVTGSDVNDTAFKFYVCYYENHASWL